MSRIVISWDYGLRLLDDDYLVSQLNKHKQELENFNWDYIMVANSDGSYSKCRDFDRIENRYDWLTKAIPELEKMCKERGINFEEAILRQESSVDSLINNATQRSNVQNVNENKGEIEFAKE